VFISTSVGRKRWRPGCHRQGKGRGRPGGSGTLGGASVLRRQGRASERQWGGHPSGLQLAATSRERGQVERERERGRAGDRRNDTTTQFRTTITNQQLQLAGDVAHCGYRKFV
jgi:hypothetical protein